MNKHYRLAVVIMFLAIAAPLDRVVEAIINVPEDPSTIQAAINATADNDEVIIAASGGPYLENITFDGSKTITIETIGGAVIDGNKNGCVVIFTGSDNSTLPRMIQ